MRNMPGATIGEHIWRERYRHGQEQSVEDTFRRVAAALAAAEEGPAQARWADEFFEVLACGRFLPAGRILAGAGTARDVTLVNCFVMGVVEDSIDGIFSALKEGAVTMQQGGGVGYDFSTLRPRGAPASGAGGVASGPVSFLDVWDATCATLVSTGARRGAMMATLRDDHPDVVEFIAAKSVPGRLRHFNLSVQVSDALVEAVKGDGDWPLVFPARALGSHARGRPTVLRRWTGQPEPVPCAVVGQVRARELWAKLVRGAYEHAEPGALYVDRINAFNNLWYAERITASNPCGEEPLPPYGACVLGSLNLPAFVNEPFTPRASVDAGALEHAARVATRMLDDVITVTRYPLEAQAREARRSRRVGLGITGLADALLMLGLHYGAPEARATSAGAMRQVCLAAYRASVELARDRGAFPLFERDRFLEGRFVQGLPADVREAVARDGLRNSHLTAIAPAGTISLMAGNVSSGIEPVFEFVVDRAVRGSEGVGSVRLVDYAYARWREQVQPDSPLPSHFVTARGLGPEAHLLMQSALQPWVDGAISKTVNVPSELPFSDFSTLFERAHALGLKGLTAFRPNPVTGEVLSEAPRACGPDRECD